MLVRVGKDWEGLRRIGEFAFANEKTRMDKWPTDLSLELVVSFHTKANRNEVLIW